MTGRPVFFYPGSSIGNFTPPDALEFLRRVRAHASGGGLLIGVDLVKQVALLEDAYDDALGVTAAFNLNALRHVNRIIGSDFDPASWKHVGLYNPAQSRIEMHLEARHGVAVHWPGARAPLRRATSASTRRTRTSTRPKVSMRCCNARAFATCRAGSTRSAGSRSCGPRVSFDTTAK